MQNDSTQTRSNPDFDYRKFVASLSKDQKIALTKKSNLEGIILLSFHFGGIVFFGFLITLESSITPLFMLVEGILIVFLFTLLHESTHKTAFASPLVNRLAVLACSYLIFLPAEWFKYFHFEHHRNTQIPGKDPELDKPKPGSLSEYVVYISGIPTWCDHLKTIFRNAFGHFDYRFVPKSAYNKIRRESRLMIMVYMILAVVSIVAHSVLLVYVWLVPVLLGQPFLRLYLLAEHTRCPFVANMFENTRTTFTNMLVRKLAWNMPYHVEHHTYPSVPFHKLPILHQAIESYIKETEHGYINFNKKYVQSFSHPD